MSRVPIGSSSRKDLGLGIADPQDLLRPVRVHHPVRGRRAHRRQVGHHPGRHRRVRAALASSGPRRPGPRIASPPSIVPVDAPDLDEDGKPTGTTHRVGAGRGPARDHPRGAGPASSRSPARTACTPPARSSQISDGAGRGADDDRGEGRGPRPHAQGPRRRHLPGRRRPGADAHRPDRRHPAPARARRPDAWTTSTSSRSTRRSPRWCWPGQRELDPDLDAGQPQRRRHRPRPPARRHRRHPHDQGPARAGAHRTGATAWSPCAAAADSAPAP